MKWFKHLCNAHKGGVLQDLYAEFGINEGHGLYFRLVEFLADKWDGVSEPRFRFLSEIVRSHVALPPKKFKNFVGILSKSPENHIALSGKFIEIYFPKLLEVRHREAISSGQRSANSRPDARLEEEGEESESKKKSENTSSFATLLKEFAIVTTDQWFRKYGREFVMEHGAEAVGYWSNKPESATWSTITWASKIGQSLQRAKQHEAEKRAKEENSTTCGVAPAVRGRDV